MWCDIQFTLRQLLLHRGFTAVVVTTLALGIGANTAIFSVINTVLLNPMPRATAERLIQISERTYIQGYFGEENGKPYFNGVTPPALEAILAAEGAFETVAWIDGVQFERRGEDFSEVVFGESVSPNFFKALNLTPLLGRTFAPDEAVTLNENGRPERDTVVVLSYTGWQSLLGGDPQALGRTIEMAGVRFTVVGVMPRHFRFPHSGIHFFFPAQPPRLPPGWSSGPNIMVYARLQPGVSPAQAQALLDTIAQRVGTDEAYAKSYQRDWKRQPGGLGFWLRPADHYFTAGKEDLQRTLWGLLGAIGFMLLIVCANVANLTLARTEKRQQELAVRAALGASRLRILRLLLTESVILSCIGGLLGLAASFWGIQLLSGLIPEFTPRLREIEINGATLLFTLGVSVATGLIFGGAPAWHAGRKQLSDALKQAGAKATVSKGRRRYRHALVVVELALTMVLLAGAGLMIQSVSRLLRVDPGFDPENLIRVSISLPWKIYNDQDNQERALQLRKNLLTQIHERLASLPGVKAVGIGKHGAWPEKLKLAGREETIEVLQDGCGVGASDLFLALRTPLQAGRYFELPDIGRDTVIINETMARKFWPGEDAVGQKFGGQLARKTRQFEIVGVVGDIRDNRYDQPVKPTFYRPCHELGLEGMRPFFVLRTAVDSGTLLPAIHKELIAAEPAMTKPEIVVCHDELYRSTLARRTYMLYLVVFAGIALGLSALGIYGVLAYSVAKRTQEIGIRMALGAERRQVLGMILSEGARLSFYGVLTGMLAAFWLTRLMQQQLFEVQPTEPVVFLGAVLLLFSVSLLACFLPARRATNINPMEALRF